MQVSLKGFGRLGSSARISWKSPLSDHLRLPCVCCIPQKLIRMQAQLRTASRWCAIAASSMHKRCYKPIFKLSSIPARLHVKEWR
jgi:hypothetical protein